MLTVNFQCGACGKLMAVGVDFLGQQVRCPHCQQVVIAPGARPATAPAPPPTPPPEPGVSTPAATIRERSPVVPPQPFTLPRMHNDHEDIFSQRSDTEDALFSQPEGPRLEVPRHPEPEPAPAPPPEPVGPA